ncbi:MAG: hypothetical protein SGJ19_05750, partial [Planctomycetia bacterium]|nr:hypothetical protein [Planctomycetia bacterium]
TGELPFRGEKRMLIVQILNDEPPSPRKLNSRVPRDLETICLKCLEKEPNKRYGTMSELSDELRRFLGGEAIQARPVGKLDRGWRWCKRQPLLASSAAAVLVSFAVAVLFACFNAVERSRADAARRESDLDAYSASVLYAHHEIETGSTTRAFDILQKCSVSLRGWEWYFLDRTANWEILRVRNAAFDTTAITISASGHLVATAHASGKVMIWDTRTGQDKSLVTGKLPVWGVAISDDESLLAASLAAANPDGLPTPPDVSRGSDLNVPDSSTSNNAVPLQAIESDSSDIFQGGEVHVYELSTGKLLSKRAHCGREHSLAFMPGRRQLVSPSPDKTVRVWDATTGHDEKVFKGHTSQPISIAVSADGSHIASGTGDHSWIGKRVRFETLIWRLDTNVPVFRLANTGRPLGFLADNRSAITVDSLHRAGLMQYADLSTGTFHVGAVSRSGGLLAFLDSGGGVNITNVVAEQPAPESEMYAHVGTVGTRLIPVSRRPAFTIHDRLLSLSHSGTRLACANSFDAELDLGESLKKLHAAGRLPSGPQLQVVDLSAILPAEINGPIRENVRFNESLASPDDRHVAFIGDMEAIIADARTGATKLDLAQSSTRVGWSNDGNRLAVATSENGTQIWDTNTWKKVVTLPTRPILCLGWRPNNRDIVMMTDAWQVQVWNINTNQLVASYDLDYKADVAEMAWSPSADRLAIATLHGLFVWDFADTTLAQTLDCPISSPIVWSADGKLLAGRGADAKSQNSVMVWETEQWTERFLHTFDDLAPNRLCFSPDAQRLAISVESLAFQEGAVQGLPYSVARGVLLCETESGRELLHIRDGSIKRLPLGVHFSRDGQRLFITGQRDDCFTLQMWDGSPRARVYIER